MLGADKLANMDERIQRGADLPDGPFLVKRRVCFTDESAQFPFVLAVVVGFSERLNNRSVEVVTGIPAACKNSGQYEIPMRHPRGRLRRTAGELPRERSKTSTTAPRHCDSLVVGNAHSGHGHAHCLATGPAKLLWISPSLLTA